MFSGRKEVGTLIVDNHSPFTPNILDCMKVLGENYLCRKFSDAISIKISILQELSYPEDEKIAKILTL